MGVDIKIYEKVESETKFKLSLILDLRTELYLEVYSKRCG